MFLKKPKGKILSLAIILVVLAFAYNMVTSTPKEKAKEPQKQSVSTDLPENKTDEIIAPARDEVQEKTKNEETALSTEIEVQPTTEEHPAPIEPQTVTISDKELQCTISIRCDNLLQNLDKLEEAKWILVPDDGIILAEKTVTFYEGESVFNVLLRETRKNGIHMEYVSTPIYNSAYIDGIHNLYEFDCGELSGWMYSVNGWFPNYGCSRYALKDGDRIEWIYTCDLGEDAKQR